MIIKKTLPGVLGTEDEIRERLLKMYYLEEATKSTIIRTKNGEGDFDRRRCEMVVIKCIHSRNTGICGVMV